jgi:leucyl/phenylalanyl-tRNA--protein transferase
MSGRRYSFQLLFCKGLQRRGKEIIIKRGEKKGALVPIYRLNEEILFPAPEHAEGSGLLAVGGDLRAERLLTAYRMGIFPWYGSGQPILWWSPDPRWILEPEELHISRRLRRVLKKEMFQVTFDQAFGQVIHGCAMVTRKEQHGTWITAEMEEAYTRLHEMGFAHSVESWREGKLVGGVYGVSLGRCFFGESMFFCKPDASKVAFVTLVQRLRQWEFQLIDAQVTTPHLARFGAKAISRALFLDRLQEAVAYPTIKGNWNAAGASNVDT